MSLQKETDDASLVEDVSLPPPHKKQRCLVVNKHPLFLVLINHLLPDLIEECCVYWTNDYCFLCKSLCFRNLDCISCLAKNNDNNDKERVLAPYFTTCQTYGGLIKNASAACETFSDIKFEDENDCEMWEYVKYTLQAYEEVSFDLCSTTQEKKYQVCIERVGSSVWNIVLTPVITPPKP